MSNRIISRGNRRPQYVNDASANSRGRFIPVEEAAHRNNPHVNLSVSHMQRDSFIYGTVNSPDLFDEGPPPPPFAIIPLPPFTQVPPPQFPLVPPPPFPPPGRTSTPLPGVQELPQPPLQGVKTTQPKPRHTIVHINNDATHTSTPRPVLGGLPETPLQGGKTPKPKPRHTIVDLSNVTTPGSDTAFPKAVSNQPLTMASSSSARSGSSRKQKYPQTPNLNLYTSSYTSEAESQICTSVECGNIRQCGRESHRVIDTVFLEMDSLKEFLEKKYTIIKMKDQQLENRRITCMEDTFVLEKAKFEMEKAKFEMEKEKLEITRSMMRVEMHKHKLEKDKLDLEQKKFNLELDKFKKKCRENI